MEHQYWFTEDYFYMQTTEQTRETYTLVYSSIKEPEEPQSIPGFYSLIYWGCVGCIVEIMVVLSKIKQKGQSPVSE